MNLLDFFDNTDPESLDIFKNDSGLLGILLQKIVSDPYLFTKPSVQTAGGWTVKSQGKWSESWQSTV